MGQLALLLLQRLPRSGRMCCYYDCLIDDLRRSTVGDVRRINCFGNRLQLEGAAGISCQRILATSWRPAY